MAMQSLVIVATIALLPNASLTQIANAKITKIRTEEVDTFEIRTERDEAGRHGPRTWPELERPLRVWTALTMGDYGGLETIGELGEVVKVVGDVLAGYLHVPHCTAR